MPVTLYLTPGLAEAQQHLLARLHDRQVQDPLAPWTLLLPTAESVAGLRRRLGRELGVTLGLRYFQFYGLGRAVLDAAGKGTRSVSELFQRRLVRHVLEKLHAEGRLHVFASVVARPGFTQALLDWLREMKSQGIFPEQVAAEAARSGLARDAELSEFYRRYQAFMIDHDLNDNDGLLWLAALELEAAPGLFCSEGPLVVLGFDQFNPLELRILEALSGCYAATDVYLAWDPHRPPGSLALTRPAAAFDRLQERLEARVVHLDAAPARPPGLEHLRRTLFAAAPEARQVGESASPAAGAPALVAAPSREAEVRQVLRQVKALLQAGAAPGEIAVLAPQPETYEAAVRAVAREYGLPLRLERRLAEEPLWGLVLTLLGLAPDFPWRGVLDALRSPYMRQAYLSPEQIEALEQLSRERPVVAGRDQWRQALRPLEKRSHSDNELGPPPLASRLDAAELAAIRAGLEAFFDHLTPPPSAGARHYTLWVQERLLGLFSLPEPDGDAPGPPEPGTDPQASLWIALLAETGPFAARDCRALLAGLQVLRRLVEAAELLSGPDEPVAWEVYREALSAALGAAVRLETVPGDIEYPAGFDPDSPGVRFDGLVYGRQNVDAYRFVLGLSEGEFPRPPAPDPLYAPAERRRLVEEGRLPLILVDPAENASLWWQVLANATREVHLTRPWIDDRGAPWQPSPYWQAVAECFPAIEATVLPIAAPPAVETAAGPAELLVALAAAGATSVPPALAASWRRFEAAYGAIRVRQGWDPPGPYEGVFSDPALRADLAGRYGEDHTWSVSRLNRYGACPYGFFAENVLKLAARPDPAAGLDAMPRGSLLHAILEDLHHELAARGLALCTAHRDAALALLGETCAAHLPGAPQRYGFRPGPLWEHEKAELERMLAALVAWECEQAGPQALFQPYRQELRFGLDGREAPESLPAFWLSASDGTRFKLHGVIDRVDRDPQGRLRVLDYKSGSGSYGPAEIEKGLALQGPLYALAAEGLLGAPVAESAYLMIAGRKLEGKLDLLEEDGKGRALAGLAVDNAGRFVAAIREGVFPSAPGRPQSGTLACAVSCDFVTLCRVDRQAVRKAARM